MQKLLNFRVCRCLGNNQIVILDMDQFKQVPAPYSQALQWVCEYENEDGETETATIWSGNIDDAATHTFLHEDDAAPILEAFFKAKMPSTSWDQDEWLTAISGDHVFEIMAEDPIHVVAWVNSSGGYEPLTAAHEARIRHRKRETVTHLFSLGQNHRHDLGGGLIWDCNGLIQVTGPNLDEIRAWVINRFSDQWSMVYEAAELENIEQVWPKGVVASFTLKD